MKVIIQQDWHSFTTRFYIEVGDYSGNRKILGINKSGEMVMQDVEQGERVTVFPLLELPDRHADLFIKGIVDYASDKGIKTVNENLLQGKLAATEKHLEDMRASFNKVLDKLLT